MIKNLEDVCQHFGASHNTNESLSRRIYKDTSCGAWAKVESEPFVETRTETWTGRYAKVDGVWEMLPPLRNGEPVEISAMPENVRFYFWPPSDAGMQMYLDEQANGASTYSHTEELRAQYPTGETVRYFVVGSAVEGSDAEVPPQRVELPCNAEALDKAVEYVEDVADQLWRRDNLDNFRLLREGDETPFGYVEFGWGNFKFEGDEPDVPQAILDAAKAELEKRDDFNPDERIPLPDGWRLEWFVPDVSF